MRTAFVTILGLQDRMNRKVHPDWSRQGYEWYRAIWIECAELMEHYGYKWWKHHSPDVEQVQLEVIDIWHFGISSVLNAHERNLEAAADAMCAALQGWQRESLDVLSATEALAADTLNRRSFSLPLFWQLMHAAELDFGALYRRYVSKNVLNLFRQDHGYKDGSYRKVWEGREDNEHLVELVAQLDADSADYGDRLYAALASRYAGVCA